MPLEIDVLVISLTSPLKVGLYKNNFLIKEYVKYEQTSEILPVVFDDILKIYRIKSLFFANGPGSFMSIKVSYIFLKTLSVSLGVELLGSDGFLFNKNRPIRAMKKVYFVKENGKIDTKIMKDEIEQNFNLPKLLDRAKFSKNCEPLYILPAV